MTVQSVCNCPVYGGQIHHNTGCSVAPLSSTATQAGKLILMAGLTFHSGRRLADHPDLIAALEVEARAPLEAEIARLRTALEWALDKIERQIGDTCYGSFVCTGHSALAFDAVKPPLLFLPDKPTEFDRVSTYRAALAHGLSDAEAREEGWPALAGGSEIGVPCLHRDLAGNPAHVSGCAALAGGSE